MSGCGTRRLPANKIVKMLRLWEGERKRKGKKIVLGAVGRSISCPSRVCVFSHSLSLSLLSPLFPAAFEVIPLLVGAGFRGVPFPRSDETLGKGSESPQRTADRGARSPCPRRATAKRLRRLAWRSSVALIQGNSVDSSSAASFFFIFDVPPNCRVRSSPKKPEESSSFHDEFLDFFLVG